MPTIDIRCPEGPRKLLMKLQINGEKPTYTDGNLIELSCDHCKATLRRRRMAVTRVLHRFDLAGELIETEVIS